MIAVPVLVYLDYFVVVLSFKEKAEFGGTKSDLFSVPEEGGKQSRTGIFFHVLDAVFIHGIIGLRLVRCPEGTEVSLDRFTDFPSGDVFCSQSLDHMPVKWILQQGHGAPTSAGG